MHQIARLGSAGKAAGRTAKTHSRDLSAHAESRRKLGVRINQKAGGQLRKPDTRNLRRFWPLVAFRVIRFSKIDCSCLWEVFRGYVSTHSVLTHELKFDMS